jgi:hypothetical protein
MTKNTEQTVAPLTEEQIEKIRVDLLNRYGDDSLPIEEIVGFLKEQIEGNS